MDIEFHYYVTYLICVGAGLDAERAHKIAYSAEYVDDNNVVFEINKDTENEYKNYISQTFNITKPQTKLQRIYPFFHFVPGDVDEYSNKLADEKCPPLTTTPNNSNANEMLEKALNSENPYKIGLAIHAFTDTWAHQNFIGLAQGYNSITLKNPIDICHTNARRSPDIPDETWEDPRLDDEKVVNKERFLDALDKTYEKLFAYYGNGDKVKEKLKNDISQIIDKWDERADRIHQYKELALKYGTEKMPEYYEHEWFNRAVEEDYPEKYELEIPYIGIEFNPKNQFLKEYNWKDTDSYKETDWYKFQEAVKEHQQMMEEILSERIEEVEKIDEW
ncbi:DUF6765 family protein [Halarsenatibacter silvermanii]|uniref:Uncharacterized protein n=1 Tax=Halarsenatibacter silvermanii TaxID=321763 RepID=A0A1G9J7K8_9FIRM|nr:DUF6765 family protein [Halarsenatibacter silvermanii]SDL33519.1 hypothetical protein SAMN04488692_103160 [Halarsenatibacter silvermanii]